MTKPRQVLSCRVEVEKVEGRGELNGVKMGERINHSKNNSYYVQRSTGYSKNWEQWEITN